jgi:type IV pilus assembly protein PilE
MAQPQGLTPAQSGMTLIELLIALVIVGILAAVAWPSFREAVNKSRRADAVSALTEIMQAQERWRSNNPLYKATLTSPVLPGTRTTSQSGHYALAIAEDSATATAYTATATVISTSPQASDTNCQVMRVVVNGGNISYTSGASSSATNARPDPCWVR